MPTGPKRTDSRPLSWERVPLGTIIERFEAGVSVRSGDRPAMDGQHGVLKVSCVSHAGFRPAENKVVHPLDLSRLGPTPHRGDVLLTRANTVELVALAVTVDRDYPHLHLSDKHWRPVLRHRGEDSLSWVKHVINSRLVRRALVSRATGTSGSMKNVSQRQFLRIAVPRPPSGVQHDIAAVLDCFEGVVAKLGMLLDAKRRFKRCLMQELLTGKRRFKDFDAASRTHTTWFGKLPASWRYPQMREIASEVTDRARSQAASLPVVSCSKYEGLVDSLVYFGKQVFSGDRSNYKIVRRLQFAYPSNHIEEGSIGLLTQYDAAVVSPIYTVFQVAGNVVPQFLYLVFKTDKCRHLFASNTNASVNRRGSMRWKQFSNLRDPLPPQPEQERIASLFETLDREMDRLTQLRDAVDKQRRAVAELLLTGKVQVPA